MFSRTREVIKNKNKVEKDLKSRRKNEMISLRMRAAFKAKLYNELKHIEVLLQDDDVDAVLINVPDKLMSMFSTAIYSEDLASYEVTQVEGESNKFFIRRKFISF